MWLDRATSELRRVELRYVNIAPELERESAGAAMDFARTTGGKWVIVSWQIRMPVVETEQVRVTGRSRARRTETLVRAIRVDGGELVLMTRAGAGDTLFARTPLAMAGTVREESSGKPIVAAEVTLTATGRGAMTDSDGRFRISDALPGTYTLSVRSASLDSLGASYAVAVEFTDTSNALTIGVPGNDALAARLCGDTRLAGPLDGVVSGSVRTAGDTMRLDDVKVFAEWRDSSAARANARSSAWVETRTDARGRFRMCGIPSNTEVTLRAETDQGAASGLGAVPLAVHLAPGRRYANVSLELRREAVRVATLTGVVLSDVDASPIADVEIAVPALQRNIFSNDRGEYRLTDIPAGAHEVVARRLGFKQVAMTLAFAAGSTVQRRILLSRVVMLDTVAVRASPRDQMMREFADNRRLGLGKFWTRDDLAKAEGLPLSTLLSQVPGSRVARARFGNYAWMVRSGPVSSLGGTDASAILPSGEDMIRGAKRACYAMVWVDNVRVYSGRPEEPLFDVNSITPDQIEAMEYYSRASQTPARYAGLNNVCGTLVIWTRRSP